MSDIDPDDVERWTEKVEDAEKSATTLEISYRKAREYISVVRGYLEQAKMLRAKKIPVDRSAVQLIDGSPVPTDRSHTEIDPKTGMQKGYIVLTAAERAKGFVRPLRRSYRHLKCGAVTTMGQALAETYARDPHFYSGTMCVTCGTHFPVGENGEFVWADGTDEKVGT